MTNGSDLLEFEQDNYQRLVDDFIKKHQTEWEQFVMEEFNNKK